MSIKQISIFVENTVGRLSYITRTLANASVSIRALCVADTTDFGILRIIASDTDLAYRALKDAGCTVSITDVIAVPLDDRVGALAEAVEILTKANVNIEYLYAFVSHDANKAYVIVRVDDNELATSVLKESNIKAVDDLNIY